MNALKRGADSVYNAVATSKIGVAFTNYDSEQSAAEQSFFFRFFRRKMKSNDKRGLRYGFQFRSRESVITGGVSREMKKLLFAQLKQYGVFLLTIGIMNLAYFGYGCIRGLFTENLSYLIIGGVEFLCSLPALASRENLAYAILDSRLGGWIIFDVLGLRRTELYKKTEKRISAVQFVFPVVAGLLLGTAGFPLNPVKPVAMTGCVLLLYIVLISPESGLVLLISFLPVLSDRVLHLGTVYTLICYIIKVFLGKRIFRAELNDFAVMSYGALLLLSSVFSVNARISLEYVGRMLVYISAYVLVVNMIKSKPWLRRVTAAICFSAAFSVICGLIQKFAIGIDFILVEELIGDGAVEGTFSSPEILARYLVLCVFYLFATFLRNKLNFVRRVVMLIVCIATVLCLYYTMSSWAMICFVIAAVLFFLIYSNRTLIVACAMLLLTPFAEYILPKSFINTVTGLVSAGREALAYRLEIWSVAGTMAKDHWLCGSGAGTFAQLYNRYAVEGIDALDSALNIYIQAIVETGFIGLAVFGVIILVFMQSNFSFFAAWGGGGKTSYVAAGFTGVFAFLMLGLTDNIWQESRITFSFFVIMAMTMAVKRHMTDTQRGYEEYLLGGYGL